MLLGKILTPNMGSMPQGFFAIPGLAPGPSNSYNQLPPGLQRSAHTLAQQHAPVAAHAAAAPSGEQFSSAQLMAAITQGQAAMREAQATTEAGLAAMHATMLGHTERVAEAMQLANQAIALQPRMQAQEEVMAAYVQQLADLQAQVHDLQVQLSHLTDNSAQAQLRTYQQVSSHQFQISNGMCKVVLNTTHSARLCPARPTSSGTCRKVRSPRVPRSRLHGRWGLPSGRSLSAPGQSSSSSSKPGAPSLARGQHGNGPRPVSRPSGTRRAHS